MDSNTGKGTETTWAAGGQVRDVYCPVCHGESFCVEDPKTGLLRCNFCRNQWLDLHFQKVTETERYLQEQSKQPRIVYENSSETDQQLLKALFGLSGCVGKIGRIVKGVVSILVLLLILFLVLTFFPIFQN